MRPVRQSLLAALLTGFVAAAACQAPQPSSAPESVPSSVVPSSAAPATAAASKSFDAPIAEAIFGPWQPVPIPIPPILVARADQACRASLVDAMPDGAVISVIDARGAGELELYYSASLSGGWATCTQMGVDRLGNVKAGRGHAVSGGSGEQLQPFKLQFEDFRWSGEPPGPIKASWLVGRAGPGITRVEIRSPGRPTIVASIANGWWTAWSPGAMPAQWRIVALDVLGRDVDTIDGVSQNQDP